jgi:hypothetical protein
VTQVFCIPYRTKEAVPLERTVLTSDCSQTAHSRFDRMEADQICQLGTGC